MVAVFRAFQNGVSDDAGKQRTMEFFRERFQEPWVSFLSLPSAIAIFAASKKGVFLMGT